jgi:hypothetical protein
VTWTPDENPFQGNKQYTAEVTLTANSGYTFNGLTTTTTNGQTATAIDNTGNAVTLTYKFSATTEATVTGIQILTQPAKLTYTSGEALDLTGLSVKLLYNDETDENVVLADFAAKNIAANPANSTPLEILHNGKVIVVSCNGYSANTDALTVAGGVGIVTPSITQLQVYPNPTSGMIYIETGSTVTVETRHATSLQLRTLQGKLLLETTGDKLDLSAYPQGVYLLRVDNEMVKVVKK